MGLASSSSLPALHIELEGTSTSTVDDQIEIKAYTWKKNASIKGLQHFIPTTLWLCPKLTLKQENRLGGAFITRFHNLLFESSWLYEVWSLLDLII